MPKKITFSQKISRAGKTLSSGSSTPKQLSSAGKTLNKAKTNASKKGK